MKKTDRIEAYLAERHEGNLFEQCYFGYFVCFNRGEYYEAHDVLEHLWLKDRKAPEARFFQGLIQVAGGFVHLKKQYERPDHPKDGRRLRPATRLFRLAQHNFEPYGSPYLDLDLALLNQNCEALVREIQEKEFQVNPWNPKHLPHLSLKEVKFL